MARASGVFTSDDDESYPSMSLLGRKSATA
jgi:hypothetical protein